MFAICWRCHLATCKHAVRVRVECSVEGDNRIASGFAAIFLLAQRETRGTRACYFVPRVHGRLQAPPPSQPCDTGQMAGVLDMVSPPKTKTKASQVHLLGVVGLATPTPRAHMRALCGCVCNGLGQPLTLPRPNRVRVCRVRFTVLGGNYLTHLADAGCVQSIERGAVTC